jgi:hypothetical protein
MPDAQIIERPAPAHDFGELMMGLLRDPSIPADKLEVVMKMRREALEYEAKEAYQHHFALFTADMPAVERDGTVDLGTKGKYPFTTYEQMDMILRPLLVKHGFSLQYWSSNAEKIDVIIVHGALAGWGWQRESVYPVPPDSGPGRNALQARGSSQTYAKRYIADLLCNIVRKGTDNDGRGAVDAFIDERQVKELMDLIRATGTNAEAFLNTMVTDVREVADVRVRDYSRLLLALKERQKRRVQKEISK